MEDNPEVRVTREVGFCSFLSDAQLGHACADSSPLGGGSGGPPQESWASMEFCWLYMLHDVVQW